MTISKLRNNEKIVTDVLERVPAARDDDYILYARILAEYRPDIARMDVIAAFYQHGEIGMPSYEGITRARRKVQKRRPDLRPSKSAAERKAENEKAYREWAKKTTASTVV